jgi:hypothetical protein
MMKEILEKIEELKKQVQELSFQQDLNKEQLLAIINDGFEEIKKKYEAAQKTFDWKNGPIICELNGYRWHLGTEADKAMNWAEAKAWCESVGGELPPRDVLLQAYLNEDIKTIFQKDWYWSGTEFNTQGAWRQLFGNGFQDYSFKTDTCYVRAVKKVKI